MAQSDSASITATAGQPVAQALVLFCASPFASQGLGMMLSGYVTLAFLLWTVALILVLIALFWHKVRSDSFALFAKNPIPWFVTLVLLFLSLSSWPILSSLSLPAPFAHTPSAVPPPIVAHDPPSAEEIEKAIAPIRAERDSAYRERDQAIKERDAARQQLAAVPGPTATPSQPTQEKLTPEDIAIKISVWQRVDQQMNSLSTILDESYAMLDVAERTKPSNLAKKAAEL
jgi:hypothetical protein